MVAHAMTAGLGGVQQSGDFGGRQVVLGAFVAVGGFAGADRRTLLFALWTSSPASSKPLAVS